MHLPHYRLQLPGGEDLGRAPRAARYTARPGFRMLRLLERSCDG
ncbi:hypothetical protein X975_24955, partial [Stegodyphus mimosarum]